MALTLNEILENENIKADRFGMAAISYIFKAFGDNIRSKEYWPWGKDVNFPWNSDREAWLGLENGVKEKDLLRALLCLYRAYDIIESEEVSENKYDKTINGYRKRLAELIRSINRSNNISDKINETSKETKDKLDELEDYE